MTSEVKLHRVSDPATADQAKLDVVFIHGLGGHWDTSWRAKGANQSWPELLSNVRPEAFVWSLEYPAIVGHWRKSIANLQQQTSGLVPRIAQSLKDLQVANRDGRPCVLVCHSLGGIVAKRLLLHANEQTSAFGIDHQSVAGVMFLGTPHRGAAMADWLQTAEKAKGVIAGAVTKAAEFLEALAGAPELLSFAVERGAENLAASSKLIEELTEGNADLAKLNERFITYWQERQRGTRPVHLRVCAETVPLSLLDRMVVDLDSADPNLHLSSTGVPLAVLQLPVNHMEICKIRSMDTETGRYLLGLVQDVLVTHSLNARPAVRHSTSEDDPRQRTQPVSLAATSAASIPICSTRQTAHAVDCLAKCFAFWQALQRSANLKQAVGDSALLDHERFVDALCRLEPESLQRVMRELRRVFKAERAALADTAGLPEAAAATVALYLLCASLVIQADSGRWVVGLPKIENEHAATLLASLIGLVMAGGRLQLRPGEGVLPQGDGTWCVQLTAKEPEHDFERQLYSLVLKKPWSVSAGLKTGGLTNDERDELLEELHDRRGDGDSLEAMSFVVRGDVESSVAQFNLAHKLKVPVFHAHEAVAHRLLGMSEATLVTMLKMLWEDVHGLVSSEVPEP